ncbi:MAG: hypothetical protein EHM63_02445 [Actinobacteria bacterium]|jgi:hypothetical protein|nr:MAG: hypothetical protein EHM63_02445 [Actinomycetota bacterium]
MPDQTNITDFDPATGKTTTTLVSTHDRGAQQEAARDGQEHDTWHRTDMSGGTPAGPAPTLASAAPPTVSAAAAATTITLTGTNFVSGAKARVNAVDQTTTFISATSVSFSYDPSAAGTVQLSVKNPDGQTSANLAFVVATLAADPSLATIDEIKQWVDDHETEAEAVLAAEEARGPDARSTLVTWLQGFIAARDDDD